MRNHSFPGSLPWLSALLLAGIPAARNILLPLKLPAWTPEAYVSSVLINGVALTGYYTPPKTFCLSCAVLMLFAMAIGFYYRYLTSSGPGIRVLYLSFDDGSDLRVSREITSLARAGAMVDFVRPRCPQPYARPSSSGAFLRYLAGSALLLARRRYHSVHVAGEKLLLALWPFLWLQRLVVADLFDPVCLRPGLAAHGWKMLRRFLYLPATTLIVPDERCFRLSPDRVKRKTLVLPDFPPGYDGPVTSKPQPRLTILYYGQLGKSRGTEIISGLLDSGKPVDVLMAGSLTDKAAERLSLHPSVKWMGSASHLEILELAATQSDFLLCPGRRADGKYESLSALYDAIQAEKPVITNTESPASRFAGCYPAGYVMPSYQATEFDRLYDNLLLFRKQFTPLKNLKESWVWDKVEKTLISAHKLSTNKPADREIS